MVFRWAQTTFQLQSSILPYTGDRMIYEESNSGVRLWLSLDTKLMLAHTALMKFKAK